MCLSTRGEIHDESARSHVLRGPLASIVTYIPAERSRGSVAPKAPEETRNSHTCTHTQPQPSPARFPCVFLHGGVVGGFRPSPSRHWGPAVMMMMMAMCGESATDAGETSRYTIQLVISPSSVLGLLLREYPSFRIYARTQEK